MGASIGPRIGIDGFDDYKKKINSLIQQGKTLDSEMKVVASSFDDEAESEEKNAKTKEVLERQIKVQEQRVQALTEVVEKCTEQYGEDADQTQSWKEALNNAQSALNGMKSKANEAKTGVKDLGKAEDDTKGKTSSFKEHLKALLTADFLKNAFSGLINGVKSLGNAFKSCIDDASNFADEINTVAQTTGLSTDAVQEFYYMSELLDVSMDTVADALKETTNRLKECSEKGSDTAKSFKKMGIEYKDSSGKLRDSEDVFWDLIDYLRNIPNETQRTALAMELFGESAKNLNPLINASAEELAQLKQEAHDTGYVLNSDMLGNLQDMDDAGQRWNLTLQTIKNRIGTALSPVITKLTNQVTEFLRNVDWNKAAELIEEYAWKAVDALKSVIDWIGQAASWFKEHGTEIKVFFTSIAGVLSVVGQVFQWLINIVKDVVDWFKNLPTHLSNAGDALVGFADNVADTIVAVEKFKFSLVKEVANAVVTAGQSIANWAVTTYNTVKNWCSSIINTITSAITSFVNKVKEIFNKIKSFFTNLIGGAKKWGSDMISGFSNSVSKASSGLIAKVKAIAETIRGYLHFSRPDFGPLRDYDTWMPDMIKGMARSVSSHSYILENAVAGLGGKMTTAMNAGTAVAGATVNMTINGAAGQNVNQLADIVMKRMYAQVKNKEYSR